MSGARRVALGAIVTPLAGVALTAGGLLGALLFGMSLKDPDRVQPLREAASSAPLAAPPSPSPRTRQRVLVVANQTVLGEPLLDKIRERAAKSPASFLIMSPQSDPTAGEHPEAVPGIWILRILLEGFF